MGEREETSYASAEEAQQDRQASAISGAPESGRGPLVMTLGLDIMDSVLQGLAGKGWKPELLAPAGHRRTSENLTDEFEVCQYTVILYRHWTVIQEIAHKCQDFAREHKSNPAELSIDPVTECDFFTLGPDDLPEHVLTRIRTEGPRKVFPTELMGMRVRWGAKELKVE